MNKEIELLHKKIEAQDKIINNQALEIARLKETLKGTTHCFDEVEHRELQEAKDNLQKDYQEAVDKINELKEDKKEAVKYINRTQMPEGYKKVLLGILGDKE